MSGANAVPASRASISSGLLIHPIRSFAECLNVSRDAKIFRELSVKNRFSISLSGNKLFAIVNASLECVSSLDGSQGAPAIQRIEQHVSLFAVVMPNDKFSGRVINDNGIATLAQLIQKLGNKHGFAGPRVAHNQEVEAFILSPQADDFFVGTGRADSNSVSVPCLF